MVKNYFRKMIQVKAIQWNSTNFDEVHDFCPDAYVEDGTLKIPVVGEDYIAMTGEAGSYVMKNENGSYCICPKHEFEEQFVEDDGRHYACAGSFY